MASKNADFRVIQEGINGYKWRVKKGYDWADWDNFVG